jgi:hypothetical protein
MARRLQQTAHDYVVIALSPALIMTLVGSLVYFLIAVFYQGDFQVRLHWVMACFVFAAVLIGRISIEEGWERAMPFGAALAIVVGIAANKFVEYEGTWIDQVSWLINWSLIAVIWWCAHKLTWDCTVIDESQDASGEGLMQIVGLERSAGAEETAAPNSIDVEGTTSRNVPSGWWQRYVEHQHRPHAPGVWVVYFSLAALPIFGVGQWFIPVASTGARRYVFWLLCVYVASGLGLLVTTSFLGLRRYLRQRRVEMPAVMSNLWLGIGAAIIVSLLIVATLLPRPSAEYAVSALPFSVGSPGGATSSRFAPNPSDAPDDGRAGQGQTSKSEEDAAQDAAEEPAQAGPQGEVTEEPVDGARSRDSKQSHDQGQSSGDESSQGNARSDGESSNSKQSSGDQAKSSGDGKQGRGEQRGGKESGGQREKQQPAKDSPAARIERMKQELAAKRSPPQEPPAEEQAEQEPPAAKSEETPMQDAEPAPSEVAKQQDESAEKSPATSIPKTSAPPPPSLPTPPFGFAAELLKWAFYAAFAFAVCYFVWRYWADILAAFRDFWAGLWGRKKNVPGGGDESVVIQVPPAPFNTFADPFATGVAGRYPLEELVRYSFEAFEAWSREHGCERKADQTPHELARDVAMLNAPMAADARNLAELYSRAAFAQGELPDTAREQLAHAWQTMRGLTRELR